MFRGNESDILRAELHPAIEKLWTVRARPVQPVEASNGLVVLPILVVATWV